MEDTKSKLQEGSAVESLTTTTYCVTGATGYKGHGWSNLSFKEATGFTPRSAIKTKTLHLLPLWGGGDRLRVFRADLHKEGSFNEAVQGCSGVFHVAAYSYVRANVIEPAINGTLNLLKSCLKTPSVRRVVFTSSISTMTAKDSAGKWRSVVDESCQNPIDRVWKTKTGAWVYVLSKLLTEEAAFQFANENSIDLVSVITTTVAGPFLTSTVPTSVQVLLSPITDGRNCISCISIIFLLIKKQAVSTPFENSDSKFSRILSAVHSRMGSIALVHIEDICSAHIFLMEHDRAEGRYICSAHSSVISQLVDRLVKEHPFSNMQRLVEEEHGSVPSEISSKKLRELENGVFHVAASMEFEVPAKEDIDSYVRANVIEPAINGTLNLLKSCLKTPSVKRVVFTSSISTMTAKDSPGKWRSVVDESCQNPIDRVWKTKTGTWVYVLSKLLTEEAAFQFANENSIDLVSVITTTCCRSIPHFNSSNKHSSSLVANNRCDSKFSRILSAVNSRMGSIALVHIEDICSAHIFLMEHDGAEGRYICSAHSSVISQLVDLLAKEHPFSNMQKEEHGSVPSEISSKKLRDLGFNFKFGLEDIIHHIVNSCVDCGFLCSTVN
ncbi:unnamed protein product [Camellia sinensis]